MAEEEVDPRQEHDAQVARALRIVCQADEREEEADRDYTQDELGELFFALTTALVQLKKVKGGKEAYDRYYAGVKAELRKRGREDFIKESRFDKEAVDIVKRTFGDDVDLSKGTTGYHLTKMVEGELGKLDELRQQLIMLANTMRVDTNHDLDKLLK